MMQTLKIYIYRPGKNEPETKISFPLSAIQVSEKLLPSRVRASLSKEGIELNELGSLFAKQGPKGTLMEIETATEKMVIMVE